MKLVSLTCSSCAAPLEVAASSTRVDCDWCGSTLEVNAGATDELADEVARLRAENALARLDREWERDRQKFMLRDKHGRMYTPGGTGATVIFIVVIIFGIFWTIMATAMAGPFGIFGLVFIGFAAFRMVNSSRKAKQFEAARQRYRTQRRKLLTQIDDD